MPRDRSGCNAFVFIHASFRGAPLHSAVMQLAECIHIQRPSWLQRLHLHLSLSKGPIAFGIEAFSTFHLSPRECGGCKAFYFISPSVRCPLAFSIVISGGV